MSALVRVSKILADRGICSRREADRFISKQWVKVNGEIAQLGQRANVDAKIQLHPKAKKVKQQQVTILLNKPIGYVSGQPEKNYKPASILIRPSRQFHLPNRQNPRWQRSHLQGLAPAGRLDIDSQGLLVLTQSGRLARQLIGKNSTIEKEYLVRVKGLLDDKRLALLNHGLSLDGKKLKPAKVRWLNKDQLIFRLKEGRKRQIRRMCELVGLNVIGLKRVRIGQIRLGNLPEGQWRYLLPEEKF